MSEIRLFENGLLARDAAILLKIHASFPKDIDSVAQAMSLFDDERHRWFCLGPYRYSPTAFSETARDAIHRQAGQRAIAGLVGVALTALDNAGQSMSLNLAAKVVSEFSYKHGKMEMLFWKDRTWRKDSKLLTGDRPSVAKIFRKYRSVAHIVAAEICSQEYLLPPHPFQNAPDADASFVATAIYFQLRLKKAGSFDDWGLREISLPPHEFCETYAPLLPTKELTQSLIGPWLDSNLPPKSTSDEG